MQVSAATVEGHVKIGKLMLSCRVFGSSHVEQSVQSDCVPQKKKSWWCSKSSLSSDVSTVLPCTTSVEVHGA